MASKPKFDQHQANDIRKKYEDGASLGVLAKEYSTTESTLARTICRVGGTVRTHNYRSLAFDDETARTIRKKYEAGARLQDLVDEYGTSVTTMSNTIQRVGGMIRPTGYAKGTRRKKPKKGILRWLAE